MQFCGVDIMFCLWYNFTEGGIIMLNLADQCDQLRAEAIILSMKLSSAISTYEKLANYPYDKKRKPRNSEAKQKYNNNVLKLTERAEKFNKNILSPDNMFKLKKGKEPDPQTIRIKNAAELLRTINDLRYLLNVSIAYLIGIEIPRTYCISSYREYSLPKMDNLIDNLNAFYQNGNLILNKDIYRTSVNEKDSIILNAMMEKFWEGFNLGCKKLAISPQMIDHQFGTSFEALIKERNSALKNSKNGPIVRD